jgi:hypothetical protein
LIKITIAVSGIAGLQINLWSRMTIFLSQHSRIGERAFWKIILQRELPRSCREQRFDVGFVGGLLAAGGSLLIPPPHDPSSLSAILACTSNSCGRSASVLSPLLRLSYFRLKSAPIPSRLHAYVNFMPAQVRVSGTFIYQSLRIHGIPLKSCRKILLFACFLNGEPTVTENKT